MFSFVMGWCMFWYVVCVCVDVLVCWGGDVLVCLGGGERTIVVFGGIEM